MSLHPVLSLLSTYILPGLVLAFGLVFFLLNIPSREGLKGYRMARRMMGCSYLLFFVALLAEGFLLPSSTHQSGLFQQLIIITIGILQAFFFTFALTTLIDVHFLQKPRLLRETLVVILPCLAAFVAAVIVPSSFLIPLFLTIFYCAKLVDYAIRFFRRYRDYENRMSNFYSDDERKRLEWVRNSFFASLTVGVLALLYSFSPTSLPVALLFTLGVAAYYAVFAIRFLNYTFTFQQMETALTDTPRPVVAAADDQRYELMQRLDRLMTTQQLYLKSDLTIEEVAVKVGESYRTVSTTINNSQGDAGNFKSWVNSFRIGEAIRLIRDGYLSQHTTDALAEACGFSNRINFYRVFKKQTGKSPTDFQ